MEQEPLPAGSSASDAEQTKSNDSVILMVGGWRMFSTGLYRPLTMLQRKSPLLCSWEVLVPGTAPVGSHQDW